MKTRIYMMCRMAMVVAIAMMMPAVAGAQSAYDYVTSPTNNTFDTGFVPTENTKVYLQLSFNSTSGSDVCGVWLGDGNSFALRKDGSTLNFSTGGSNIATASYNITVGNIYCVTFSLTEMTIDSKPDSPMHLYSKTYECKSGMSFGNTHLMIGSFGGSQSSYGADIKIYDCIIYENGKKVHEYIPSRSNGLARLYDIMTGTFISPTYSGEANKSIVPTMPTTCQHRYAYPQSDGRMHCPVCNVDIELSQFKNTSNSITVSDPALNLQGELAHQVMSISSGSSITAAKVQEKTTGRVRYESSNLSSTSTGLNIDLKPVDYPDTLEVLFKTQLTQTIGTRQDTVPAWLRKEVAYLPLHKPVDIDSWVNSTTDKSGIKTSANHIEFAIDSLNVTKNASGKASLVAMVKQDTQSDDQFIIQRSFTSDFKSYTQLEAVQLDAPDSLERVVARDGSEKYRGWYRYEDTTTEGQTGATVTGNTVCAIDSRFLEEGGLTPVQRSILKEFYTYPERKVYYRVWRTLAYSVWSDSPDKSYIKTDSIMLTDVVPGVDSIRVVQNANWTSNKKVNVTFKLMNPYPWEYNTMLDAQQIKDYANLKGIEINRRYMWDSNASVIIERKGYNSEGKEVSSALKRITVDGSKINWVDSLGCFTATFQDVQDLPYTRYYYSAWVDESSTKYPIANKTPVRTTDAEAVQSESKIAALISDLKVSHGTDRGCVTVEWEPTNKDITSLMVQRREFKSASNDDWETLSTDKSISFYRDQNVKTGTVYEYRVTAGYYISNLNNTYTTQLSDKGWESFYGKIGGRVMMNDGTAMAGVKIYVKRDKPVFIADVTDEYGHILMQGVHEGVTADARHLDATQDTANIHGNDFRFERYAVTNVDGYWSIDSVYITDQGCLYETEIQEYPGIFQYKGIQQNAQVTLTAQKYEDTAVDFRYVSTTKITGYAYYTNSTVAVPGARFYLDGTPLKDSNGNYVTTQPDGKYSLTISSQKKIGSLEIRKDGHKFVDNGVIRSNTVVTKQVDRVILYDNTTVRVAGRICGGDIQGNKALGQGLSTNNLGDSLMVELQLEGDVTASLVYFPADPDRSTISKTTQTASGTTQITMERKRMYIMADKKTGEFIVDLFPAKYKVTKISAIGYPSLYTSGEGLMVVDYSDIVPKDGATYDATFTRVYHEPLTVTYTPMHNGREIEYSGEQTITHTDGNGREYTQRIWDEKNGYYFSNPVFLQNYMYQYRVYAHEDYLYNKSLGGSLDIVPVGGDSLIIHNGLASNDSTTVVRMDSEGKSLVYLLAANCTFNEVGDNALRTTTFTVLHNGEYTSATPLSGFVLGEHVTGVDTTPMGSYISLIDVLRDPPGCKSYAYRDRGTTYEWNYDCTTSSSINTTIESKFGWGLFSLTGLGFYLGGETDVYGALNANMVTQRKMTRTRAYYKMTTTEKISTSSDAYGIGAGGDVYIGLAKTYALRTDEEMTVIDSLAYSNLRQAINKGAVKVVAENTRNNTYIVIGDKMNIVESAVRSFAYSQKHILNNIIPSLYKQLWSLLSVGDSATVFAGESDVARYWLDEENSQIYFKAPSGDQFAVNVADSLLSAIKGWISIVMQNERIKINAIGSGNPYKQYSVSDVAIECNESAETYYNSYTWHPSAVFTFSGGAGASKKPTDPSSNATKSDFDAKSKEYNEKNKKPVISDSELIKSGQKLNNSSNDINNNQILENSNSSNMKENSRASIAPRKNLKNASGLLLELGFTVGNSVSSSIDQSYIMTNSAGYGYVMDVGDDSYLDVDVYHVTPGIEIDGSAAVDLVNSLGNDQQAVLSSQNTIQNYVFCVRGGATRNPWIEPDSTVYYNQGTPLGVQTLKIDNPKIYIDQPVVNNIAKNESAVFQIRLTNACEATLNEKVTMKPAIFHLRLVDNSNPYGAKVYMDGQPISEGRTFTIAAGESISKTIEVARGTNGYDYENLRLCFYDDGYSIFDYANISVHYLPESTPLSITSPADKWVMNTYSSRDKDSLYYMPVSIGNFDANCDNFHHIELQYKRHNDGEDQWTNIRSFFKDESLYKAWTGTKQMLTSLNSIENIPFYGGTNIEEQEYDLRAVSFCTYGNGYVTKASTVLSGIKDTRRPEIFGVPTPANGVLTFQDVIEFPYTEKIAYNHLNNTSNFTVQGYTSDTQAVFSESLHFSGGEGECAKTGVDRVLANRSFTIDMMAKIDTVGIFAPVLFYHGAMSNGSENNLLFMLMPCDMFNEKVETDIKANKGLYRLVLYTSDGMAVSYPLKGLSPQLNLTRVGLIMNQESGLSIPGVSFIADKNIIQVDTAFTHRYYNLSGFDYVQNPLPIYKGIGPIYIGNSQGYAGSGFKGEITEFRLWSKALNNSEISETYGKRLSGYNRELIGYWPLNEGYGTLADDKANGATLSIHGATWSRQDGISLKTDHRTVSLVAKEIAAVTHQDYTMTFWFRCPKDSKAGGTIALMTSGNNKLSTGLGRTFFGFQGDSLLYTTMDVVHVLGKKQGFTDGNWHNFTVIKNKSHNTGEVYLDGSLSYQGTSDDIDRLSDVSFTLGDPQTVTNFDQFAIWNKALSVTYLCENFDTRLSGKESDLKIYLPFETEGINQQSVPELVFSATNQVLHKEVKDYGQGVRIETGKYVADGTLLIEDATDGKYSSQLGYEAIRDNTLQAPLRTEPELSNLDFSWSSTGTALQININREDKDINKQYINVTVRDVEDEQGNVTLSPHMWTYFVDKNILKWDKQTVNITVPYGESMTEAVTWKNKSGRRTTYSISNEASWLKLSTPLAPQYLNRTLDGTAEAQEENEVILNIGDGLSPGQYSETLYLTDDNDLSEPLIVNLTVEATDPGWEVDKTRYEYSMNLRGQVYLNNQSALSLPGALSGVADEIIIDNDPADKVAAFVGMECVGVGNISVKNNVPMVYLTIYGDTAMQRKQSPLTLRLWHASTGEVFELAAHVSINNITEVQIPFQNRSYLGLPPNEPYALTLTDIGQQEFTFDKGWNWFSLNLEPQPQNDGTTRLINTFRGFTDGDVIKRIDFRSYNGVTKSWEGSLQKIEKKYVFQCFARNGGYLTVRGKEFDIDNAYIEITDGKWSDLPYYLSVVQPINVAMSDCVIGEKATVGDIIKGYDGFAVANSNGQWEGSLEYMRPGHGYYFYHTGNNTSFHYSKLNNYFTQTTTNARCMSMAKALTETSMPVIAVMEDSIGYQSGDVLEAYCNGELIASCEALPIGHGDAHRFFLNLHANDGDVISFALNRGGESQKASTRLKYDGSKVAGELDTPCVISILGSETISSDNQGDTYTIQGYRTSNTTHSGVYINNNRKYVK